MRIIGIPPDKESANYQPRDNPAVFAFLTCLHVLKGTPNIHGVLPNWRIIGPVSKVMRNVTSNRCSFGRLRNRTLALDSSRFDLQHHFRARIPLANRNCLTHYRMTYLLPSDVESVGTAQIFHHPALVFERDLGMVAADIIVLDADLAVFKASDAEGKTKAESLAIPRRAREGDFKKWRYASLSGGGAHLLREVYNRIIASRNWRVMF